MPPPLAALLTLGFIAFLFRRDLRKEKEVSQAMWIPFFWVFISATRFFSQWVIVLAGVNIGGTSVEEGSPIDALTFALMIAAGLYILNKRQVRWSEFMQKNPVITLYLVYCVLAILWSDFPIVAAKRWIKLLGQPVMVLLIFSEPRPLQSLMAVMKRAGYVIILVSVLFIKYYPQYGRGFSIWSGGAMNFGAALDKNILGSDCMIIGLFFFWHFVETWRSPKSKARRNELILAGLFLYLVWWLMSMAHSGTALVCLLISITVFIIFGFTWVQRRLVGTYLVVAVIAIVVLESFFGVFHLVIQLLGKDTTLTGRTELWVALSRWDINPIFGAGFESFWLGDRPVKLAKSLKTMFAFNEAHNGYLETYINLGLLGVAITLAMLVAAFFKIRRELLRTWYFGRFCLGYFLAFIMYNWTEAGFRTHAVIFFVFFITAIEPPRRRQPVRLSETSIAKKDDIEAVQQITVAPKGFLQSPARAY